MVVNPAIRAAFVSTNSITQGEQVGVLWPDLFQREIKFTSPTEPSNGTARRVARRRSTA
jgi:hypothetical protein